MVKQVIASAEEQNRRAAELYEELGLSPKFGEPRDWGNLLRTHPGEVLLDNRPPCGTTAGYSRHKREGEPQCFDCLNAHNEAGRLRKERLRNGLLESKNGSNEAVLSVNPISPD